MVRSWIRKRVQLYMPWIYVISWVPNVAPFGKNRMTNPKSFSVYSIRKSNTWKVVERRAVSILLRTWWAKRENGERLVKEKGCLLIPDVSFTKVYTTRFYRVHSNGSSIHLEPVAISVESLDPRYTFVLDTGLKIYIWYCLQSKNTLKSKARWISRFEPILGV